MEDQLQVNQKDKNEGKYYILQKMLGVSRNDAQFFAYEIDYLVEENGKFYIAYGQKQSLFPLEKLPIYDREKILQDQKDGSQRDSVNKVPLTNFQLSLFEDLLEQNFSSEIVEELKIFYLSRQIVPVLKDDHDGYKKKIFENFIKHKPKYTVRIGGLRIDLITSEFLKKHQFHDEKITTHKRCIDDYTCELLLTFETIREYCKKVSYFQLRGYNLQMNEKHNQTKIVLDILKQMYVEASKDYYSKLQSIPKDDISNDLAQVHLERNVDDKLPFDNKTSNDKEENSNFQIEKSIQSTQENSTQQNHEKKKKSVIIPWDYSVESLIIDIHKIFSYIKSCQKFQNAQMPMNSINNGGRKSIGDIIQLNSPFYEIVQDKNLLSEVQKNRHKKIFIPKEIQNFINHLKENQQLDLSSLIDLKVLN